MPPASPTPVLDTKRGKQILLLLLAVAFLDFVDASIVNVALPSISADLGFTIQNLQWVLSGYLLTYGGLMLLGGRAADLFGRRRLLVSGTVLFAVSSLAAGVAPDDTVLILARMIQGSGAAMMIPAALSILTTTFSEPGDRIKALGAWGAVGGLASAFGVFLGGVITDFIDWRWVFFVNLPAAALILRRDLPAGARRREARAPREPRCTRCAAGHRRDAPARVHDRRGARRRLGRGPDHRGLRRRRRDPRHLRRLRGQASPTPCSRSRSSGSRASWPPT